MAEEDLIFGKNRHLFGGIEPNNMKEFKVEATESSVKITASLPDDTIVDGQTLCSVVGSVIRRKNNGFPKDEFDGELVADIKTNTVFVDESAEPSGRYYYSAFPYTTQGVYNRNKSNRADLNIPIMTIKPLEVHPYEFVVSFTIPSGYSGVVVRKSTVNYPASETDGVEIGTFTSNGSFTDLDITDEAGTKYFYSFFLYNSDGIYMYDERNRIEIEIPKTNYVYGYDLTTATPNPSTRVSYPDDVDNAGFTPAKMDFTNDVFKPGSWDLTPGHHFMPRPCMLKYDGTVAHYLNPNNYAKKEDGTASKVADSTFTGNAMMEWPKIYTKRWEENGVYHFRCSDRKQDEDWDCWCNYDKNDKVIDHFYTSIYQAGISGNRLRSISGVGVGSSQTYQQEVKYATANGADWYVEVLADRLLITDLLVMIGKSTNAQTVFGRGISDFYNGYYNPGEMDDKGLFWGKKTGGQGDLGVKVFGMEHFWGNKYHRVAGWFVSNLTHKVKLTRGRHDGTTVSDYNLTGNGYLSSGQAPKSDAYLKSFNVNSWGRLPIAAGGSSTTFECDYIYSKSGALQTACLGGHYYDAEKVGPFAVDLDYEVESQNTYIRTTLSCKPSAK